MATTPLNPSAATFKLGGPTCVGAPTSPSATSTTMSSASASEADLPLNLDGDADHESTIPAAPTNTPVAECLNTHPKVAASLGEGWLTGFPPASSFPSGPNTPSKASKQTPTTPTRSLFLRASPPHFTLTHRAKSPSLPEILPSDEARQDKHRLSPTFKSNRAKVALQHLSAMGLVHPNDSKSKYDGKFETFAEEDEHEPIIVDWTKGKQPPSYAPFTPSRSHFALPLTSPTPKRTLSTSGLTHFHYGRETREPEMILDHVHPASTGIGEGRNVYIPELAATASEEVLRKVGQTFGRVVAVKVEHNGNTAPDSADMLPDGARRSSRTYAFVMFDTAFAANQFMQYMAENNIACQHGKETPHLKQKALEDPHSSNLYVAEIPLNITEQEMQDLFYPGIISSLRFLTDDQGNRRGTAMVRLQSRAQAEDAIRRLDLKVQIAGCSKPLQVRIADSENQKQLKKRTNMMGSTDAGLVSPSPSRVSSFTTFPSATAESPSFPGATAASVPFPGATQFSEQLDDLTLLEHMKALEAELRRRQSNEVLRQGGSSEVLHHRAISLQNPSPVTPNFDFLHRRPSVDNIVYRRPSVDNIDVVQSILKSTSISRKPSFDASMGREYETPTKQVSRKPALDVTVGRASYTPTKSLSRWESNGSHDGPATSSGSASSSLNSFKDNGSRYRDVSGTSDVFRDTRPRF